MDGAANDNNNKPECGWVKLYTPEGVLVTMPVTERTLDYAAMLRNVAGMIAAGFSATAPGLVAGEDKETVGWIVRGSIEQDGGKRITPFVLLYSDNEGMKFSFLKVYLNGDDDVRAFEDASGLKLDKVPVYVGNDKPERGKSRQLEQFFVKPRKHMEVILIPNPSYSKDEKDAAAAKTPPVPYKVPARVFLRWHGARPVEVTDRPSDHGQNKPRTMAEVVEWVRLTQTNMERAGQCRQHEIVNFMLEAGRKNNQPANPLDWTPEIVPALIEWIENFRENLKKNPPKK